MSKLLESAALLLGGFSILAVCFLGFSLTAGVPLHELAVVGKLFDAPSEHGQTTPVQGAEEPHALPRAEEAIVADALGVLGTWSLPSPYNHEELRALAEELKGKSALLDVRAGELDRRELDLKEQGKLVDERFEGLRELLRRLEDYELELTLREQGIQRDEAAAAERNVQRSADLAGLFENLEPDAGASFLAVFTPDEAAGVLRQMDVERAAELLNALRSQSQAADWKAYLDAYSRHPAAKD